ncbi:S8 family serine peptidase [Miltoncostaea marina]|uniref:S8 family serine peptidase n=1 Tax=Miltoncostaea marina TaxID=2843215 RepID=UPI001C3E7736|nr:S8 family serine peptidase [Miltoncostaea marina]
MSTDAPLPSPRRRAGRAPAGLAAALVACLLAPAAASAGVSAPLDRELARTAPGERVPVIVTLRDQVDPSAHGGSPAGLRRALRAAAARTQPDLVAPGAAGVERFWIVNAIALRATPRRIARLAADPRVAEVSLDAVVRTAQVPAGRAATWGLDAIRAPEAWRATGLTGAGVRIGSIDTGVDAAHPALAGRIAAWRDFVAGAPAPYDDNGHGTHTVGTMVGGGATPIGVAPGATVVVAKAMGRDGAGRGSDILAAAQWMADPDGDPATADQPQVVNNSWGTTVRDDPWFRPMVQRWIALGIVPVFSAGNTGPGPGTIGSPADDPETLAVGAVDARGEIAPFSSRGLPGGVAKPDLVAPGVGVVSSVPGGGEASYSGTSMAAPHVTGAAALVRQAAPGLAPGAVMDLLRRTATDRGPAGFDTAYGAGLLDVPAALAAAGVAVPAPAASPPAPAQPAARRAAPAAAGVSLASMRAARRIALTADRRARAIERRVTGRRVAGPRGAAPASVRLRPADLARTRAIALGAIRRADRLDARLRGRPVRTAQRASAARSHAALSPARMRATTRLARNALDRTGRLARLVRHSR